MRRKKNTKTKATVCFTEQLLKNLDRDVEKYWKPRLGWDRSDVIAYFCERGIREPIPNNIADLLAPLPVKDVA